MHRCWGENSYGQRNLDLNFRPYGWKPDELCRAIHYRQVYPIVWSAIAFDRQIFTITAFYSCFSSTLRISSKKLFFLHVDCLIYYLHLYGFLDLPPANKHTTFPTHTGCVDLLIALTHTQLALSSDSHLIFCTCIMHTRWTPQVASGSYHSCAITYDDVGQYCSKVTGTSSHDSIRAGKKEVTHIAN